MHLDKNTKPPPELELRFEGAQNKLCSPLFEKILKVNTFNLYIDHYFLHVI